MGNKECDAYYVMGPNSAAFRNQAVASFNGYLHHRFADGTHLPDDYQTDVFRSSLNGLWVSSLQMQQSGAQYGGLSRISKSAIAPASSTCNGTAAAYQITSVTNLSQYAAGDLIRIAGAGAASADLDTVIANIAYDGSAVYIKDPIVTTVTGAALNLRSAVGDIKFKSAPSAGGTIGWVCTTAGQPGTWKTFGAIAA